MFIAYASVSGEHRLPICNRRRGPVEKVHLLSGGKLRSPPRRAAGLSQRKIMRGK